MPRIKDPNSIAQKWARVTQGRSQDYQEGVTSPRVDWASATTASEGIWKQAIADAAAKGRFAKGVAAAGSQKWQNNALKKGVPRWSEGIAVSTDEYAKGFGPYAQVISATTLPPRGPKGDPRNYERSRVMGTALHSRKVGA